MVVFRDIDFHGFIESLIKTIELKDIYTAGHSKRVSEFAEFICRAMGMGRLECEYLHVAGHLHDIGKIGIPDGILLKTGRLSQAEYAIMQQHSIIGASIFENQEGFKNMAEIIRHHHERFDGMGYPDRLKGDDIPLEAAIISVADSFDAMTSSRTYRIGLSVEKAIEDIRANRGRQFHPDVVDAFIRACLSEGDKLVGVINGHDPCRRICEYVPFGSCRAEFGAEENPSGL